MIVPLLAVEAKIWLSRCYPKFSFCELMMFLKVSNDIYKIGISQKGNKYTRIIRLDILPLKS